MLFNFSSPPPLSLYVHFPWCIRKCPYCDFNSHETRSTINEKDYITALVSDLERDLPHVWGRTVESIFIGGGTPSLISPEGVDGLLSAIRARLPLRPDLEITLEANPGTMDKKKLAGYKSAGINRISIGIQSFNDELLQAIGRIHNGKEALKAAESVKAAGFDNWNIDLMYGLPQQSTAQARNDINQAIELSPPHISHYQLTIEPNTYFFNHPPVLPAEENIWEMQQLCEEKLETHGYTHYEVSAYAKDDNYCRHNINYWEFGDYLGIGAGAHSKITDMNRMTIIRRSKHKHPKAYVTNNQDPERYIADEHQITNHDIAFEFMMNALRLKSGFHPALFQERTGDPLTIIENELDHAESRGLIFRDHQIIRATEQGWRYLNDLLLLFLPQKNTTDKNKEQLIKNVS